MKKVIFVLATGCLMMAPMAANAQFFKKLLKTAGEVLTESATNVPAAQSQFGGVKNISVEWTECVRWGDNVNVKFALCNTGNSDITMTFYNTWPSGEKHSFAIAENGDRYGIDIIYLGGAVDDSRAVTVPAGIKVQCIARVNKAGGNVSKFKYVSVGGWNPGQSSPNWSYISPNMEVKEVSNTNRDNLKCTLPSVTVNENAITREGQTVKVDFCLIQATDRDVRYSLSDIKVFDKNGTPYLAELQPSTTVNTISEVPANLTLIIKNVPVATVFSIIRMKIADQYLIEWRNVTSPNENN